MRRGFTLLELMIVIIIIGLLAAIGVTQYSKAIVNTKNAQGKAVLGEMRKAAVAYQAANGSWPSSSTINVDLDSDGTNDITFAPPTGTSTSHTFTTAAAIGTATKGAATGVCTYTIDYTTGTVTQGVCN